jgi:uncharacterized membrane protein YhiD involved in acid resistance
VRRAIVIALLIVVAVVFLNDVGRWVNSQSQLNESTTQLADWAAVNVHVASRDSASRLVTTEGEKRGIKVYQYDQDQNSLKIWSSVDVPGTWVVGPYVAVTKGVPIDQALGVPFVVRSYRQTQLQ